MGKGSNPEKGHGIHQWDFYEKNSELWIQDFHTKDQFNISEMIQEKYKSSIVNLMKHCGAFLNGDHNKAIVQFTEAYGK